jgi:hypothetical protein
LFAVTLIGEEPLPKGKKGNPKKIYEVEFTPAAAGSGLLSGGRADDNEPARGAARRSTDRPPF